MNHSYQFNPKFQFIWNEQQKLNFQSSAGKWCLKVQVVFPFSHLSSTVLCPQMNLSIDSTGGATGVYIIHGQNLEKNSHIRHAFSAVPGVLLNCSQVVFQHSRRWLSGMSTIHGLKPWSQTDFHM